MSFRASLPMEMGCTTLPPCECVHPPGSSTNLTVHIRPETINYIGENIGTKLTHLHLREGFMYLIPKAREVKAKINTWDCIKLKNFCTGKETYNKTKRQPTEWEKIFANNSSDNGLICRIYKELKQHTKQTTQLKYEQRT